MTNGISYDFGRVVVRRDQTLELKQTDNGLFILDLLLAEGFSERKDRAKRNPSMQQFANDKRNESKADTDYIDTYTEWHQLTIFGAKAEALATNPNFGPGAVLKIKDATYAITGEFTSERDGKTRFRRQETIGDKAGSVEIRFNRNDDSTDPVWDGVSPLAKPGGNGGGGKGREYGEDEGI